MTHVDVMTQFLAEQLPAESIGGVRSIRVGDEGRLAATELVGLERSVLAVRRASGAGRELARELCKRGGIPVADIPRAADRRPQWPPGIVGSIAHDQAFAAAVVAFTGERAGVGIDIEPTGRLPAGARALVGSPTELADFQRLPHGEMVLFSLKEAVFKAVFPRDQRFLEFHDVTVDYLSRTATTRYGRTVCWRALAEPHILTVAWW
jgi:4'-phosphopantetheinyl transferase EntD